MSRRRNKYYDRKLKLQAVQDYFGGGGSLRTICKKHGIKDKKQLRNRIKWYNGHKEIKERRAAGTEIYMTKGRKTTEKERAEIVAFCIEHGKNYPLTIKTYGVSYQQIYAWVRKYEEKGVAGLVDGRGRNKPESEMTEVEKLRVQNKLLQAQIKDKEIRLRNRSIIFAEILRGLIHCVAYRFWTPDVTTAAATTSSMAII